MTHQVEVESVPVAARSSSSSSQLKVVDKLVTVRAGMDPLKLTGLQVLFEVATRPGVGCVQRRHMM
jgi:hypothetical protein